MAISFSSISFTTVTVRVTGRADLAFAVRISDPRPMGAEYRNRSGIWQRVDVRGDFYGSTPPGTGDTTDSIRLRGLTVGETYRVQIVSNNLDDGIDYSLTMRSNTPATGTPTISGAATVGQTLTANQGSLADANGLPNTFPGDYSFQWLRDGVAISGATARTYTVTTADAGARLSVRVSFEDGADFNESRTSAQTAMVPAINTPATGTPTISGAATVGQTLTANQGSLADSDGLPDGPFPTDYSLQWQRDGVDIPGATARTYTVTMADAGARLSVWVSFEDGADFNESRTSAQTAMVPAINTPATGTPTISGAATVGQTLTANQGSLADANGLPDGPFPTDYSFQWQRDGVDIPGATARTYTVTMADAGARLSVWVSFEDGADFNESRTSAQTAMVPAINTPATGTPTISGAATVGQTLTANQGSLADSDGLPDGPFPTDYSFQWLRDGVAISGATARTYTVTTADAGARLSVRVSFEDGADFNESRTSAQTAMVPANNPATGMPTITGSPRVAQTLTAGIGTVADSDGLPDGPFPTDYSFQWLRGGVDIPGATSETYEVTNADVGSALRVVVSFTDDIGFSESRSSATTATVSSNASATGEPSIAGTVKVGETLTARRGTIADLDGLPDTFPDDYTFQWIRGADDIDGATARTYELVKADTGEAIKVMVFFVDDLGGAESRTSAATAAVAPPDAASAPRVTINAIPAGAENTRVTLGATLTGGNYDEVDYEWRVDRGSLDETDAEEPKWTRPHVIADADVAVALIITARGTGTNAENGTSATATATLDARVTDLPAALHFASRLTVQTTEDLLPVFGEEVALGGKFFKLADVSEAVARQKISSYAAKVAIGEHTDLDDPILSSLNVADHRGGILLNAYAGDAARNTNRCWFSTCNLRHDKHLLLPPRIHTAATPPRSETANVSLIRKWNNKIYVCHGPRMRRYNPATDTWHTVHTFPSTPTDSCFPRFRATDGTVTRYFVVVYGTGYSYAEIGADETWTDMANGDYVRCAFWDGKAWGITESGLLKRTLDPTDDASWMDDALLFLEVGEEVKRLLKGRRPGGAEILYVVTNAGLYEHHADDPSFVSTSFTLPLDDDNGVGTERWRESLYVSSGLGIYKYDSAGAQAVLSTVGLDKDDGLPANYRWRVVALIGSHNDLIAFVSRPAGSSTGRNGIYAYDNGGWHNIYLGPAGGDAMMGAVAVTTSDSSSSLYRLWFAEGQTLRWLQLHKDQVNPLESGDPDFGESAFHISPWFESAELLSNKVGLVQRVQVSRMSATEKVRGYVSFDRDPRRYPLSFFPVLFYGEESDIPAEGFTEITHNGIYEARLTNREDVAEAVAHGTLYQVFRWEYELERASGDANSHLSPDVNLTSHVYYKDNVPRHQYVVTLDISGTHRGRDRQAMIAELRELSASPGLKAFVYERSKAVRYVIVPEDSEFQRQIEHPDADTFRLTLQELF